MPTNPTLTPPFLLWVTSKTFTNNNYQCNAFIGDPNSACILGLSFLFFRNATLKFEPSSQQNQISGFYSARVGLQIVGPDVSDDSWLAQGNALLILHNVVESEERFGSQFCDSRPFKIFWAILLTLPVQH